MESYATNVFLVLALQQIGAGASDCGLLLTFLNLPSAASFQSKSFSRIENCVRPYVMIWGGIREAVVQDMIQFLGMD